jgi:hypothetical protein
MRLEETTAPPSSTAGTARAHADLRAHIAQGGHRSAAALAEGEILARNHARRAQLAAQHGMHPIMRAGGRHRAIKGQHQHRIHPGGGKPLGALVQVERRKGADPGAKNSTGCGSKVATIAGRPVSRAQRTASPTTA